MLMALKSIHGWRTKLERQFGRKLATLAGTKSLRLRCKQKKQTGYCLPQWLL